MFIVRTQFNAQIAEQTFTSESQAITTGYKTYCRGGWQSIMVINTETDDVIVEWGDTPQDAMNKAWRTLHHA